MKTICGMPKAENKNDMIELMDECRDQWVIDPEINTNMSPEQIQECADGQAQIDRIISFISGSTFEEIMKSRPVKTWGFNLMAMSQVVK